MDERVSQDAECLWKQANLKEKELMDKRSWLMGLPQHEKEDHFLTEKFMPEFLLREDDISYETIKSSVEKGVKKFQFDMQLVHSPTHIKAILSIIDNMTNEGLLRFAEALTRGSVKLEKTRFKMKQAIKECLLKQQNKSRQISFSENQSSILQNPRNYRWSSESRFIPDADSLEVAVHNILNILEDLSIQTLSAMNRKLGSNKNSYTPQLLPKKSGWTRKKLTKELNKKCLKLLSKLNKGDPLPVPLAKAMEVASLDLKLIQGCHHVTNFIEVSYEVNALQNEIAMLNKLFDQKSKLSKFKDIKLLLDPDSKLSDRKFKILIKNWLKEYLFECSDMDPVPECLLGVLAMTTKSYEGPYMKLTETKTEEEVECILRVSACMKQLMLDLIPERETDIEFADAYMEDLEHGDGDDFFEDIEVEKDKEKFVDLCISNEEVGSFGDNFDSVENSKRMNKHCSTKSRSLNFTEVANFTAMRYHLVSLRNSEQVEDTVSLKDSTNKEDGCLTPSLPADLVSGDDRSMCENLFLDVQAASDVASMAAYDLIGRMLYNFAQTEGVQLSLADKSNLGVSSSDQNPKKRKASGKEVGCSAS